ncbi:OmpA family protein [Flexivirga alba]|uniref:OmpA family protein n=1 Tax=Flexivirga alba TaxID=702742 RepID=A0ABW2ANX0_9MICO
MPRIGLGSPYSVGAAWAVTVVDTKGLKLYLPLASSGAKCLCSTQADITEPGGTTKPEVGWAVLPPLPESLKSVTVQFGFGNLVVDVPVSDQLPSPATSKSPVTLGNGWPQLPDATTIKQADPKQSIRPLVSNVADPDTATKRSSGETAISVDADVLFDYGKATLTTKAHGTLQKVAAQLSSKGKGNVSVVGYTDNSGSASFNQSLSQQRAQSVQKELQKLVHKDGLTFSASGKGENDPVADNATKEGRQLNRRVTVTFQTGARSDQHNQVGVVVRSVVADRCRRRLQQ